MTGRVLPFRRLDGRIQEMSDEALVGACAFEDAAALGALFDRHHQRVHRFLCRIARIPSTEAEDLLQETFAAVWTSAKRFKGQATALTWLFGIAANVARNHSRGRMRRANAMQLYSEQPKPDSERADDVAARREMLVHLERALDQLTHDQRVVFVLCDLEEISGNEAAQALGVRPGTVWRWLHEARKKLRATVREEER